MTHKLMLVHIESFQIYGAVYVKMWARSIWYVTLGMCKACECVKPAGMCERACVKPVVWIDVNEASGVRVGACMET